jgi:hypothetical protein
LEGYATYFNKSTLNQNDGVIVYVKNDINHSAHIISIENFKFARINAKLGNTTFGLTALYRLPSLDPDDFLGQLQIYIPQYCTKAIEVIAGDMNIDILRNKSLSSEVTRSYLNIMSVNGFISCINNSTRSVADSESCIDHIFLRCKVPNDSILRLILNSKITDHSPTLVQINFNNEMKSKPKIITITDYHKIAIQANAIKWNEIKSGDIDSQVNNLINVIQNLKLQNTKFVQFNSKNKKRKPWITSGVIKSINIRDKLFKEHRLNPNNKIIKDLYTEYCIKIRTLIGNLIKNYYRKIVENNANNPKSMGIDVKFSKY